MFERITPVIITFDEAPNISRTLARLSWAKRVLIVDSGSTDGTRDLALRHDNVTIIQRPFDTHASQWNFAIGNARVDTEWILALDADYLLSDELLAELGKLSPDDETSGYRVRFRYCIFGRPIRSGAYPPVVVLFRHGRGHYVQDGHTQRLVLDGRVGELEAVVYHDDRKPVMRWLTSQKSYAVLEFHHLQTAAPSDLATSDRLRRLIVVAPLLMLLYTLFVRGGILDGWRGIYYSLQRSYAELLLSLLLLEHKLQRRSGSQRSAN